MSITITKSPAGLVDVEPQVVSVLDTVSTTLAQITATNYLYNAIQLEGISLSKNDLVLVNYNAGASCGLFSPSFSFSNNTNNITLVPCFPSVSGTSVINDVAVFGDTHGSLIDASAVTAAAGGLQAGYSGTAGVVTSYPATAAKGKLVLSAVNNTGDTAITISNAAMGQASVISIPDPGAATSNFVLAKSIAPSNNVTFTKVVTIGFAALATAGKFVLVAHPSATSQFAILDIKVLKSTGLSGSSGDRLLVISDGTIVFNNAGITAALLGTPILTVWGGTGNPVAVGASEVSTAGADIYAQYSGGTLDYSAGSVQIAVTFVQVTA